MKLDRLDLCYLYCNKIMGHGYVEDMYQVELAIVH